MLVDDGDDVFVPLADPSMEEPHSAADETGDGIESNDAVLTGRADDRMPASSSMCMACVMLSHSSIIASSSACEAIAPSMPISASAAVGPAPWPPAADSEEHATAMAGGW